MPDNPGWWDGARAARGFIEAIIKASNAKEIIPTDINMIIGIANKYYNKIDG